MSTTLTLKEIDAANAAKREWIRKRDLLTDAVATARGRLKQLEFTLQQRDDAGAALENILVLVGAVPDGLHTRGNGLGQAGGFDVAATLKEVASNALIDVAAARQRRQAELPQAQRKLADVESALERHTRPQAVHAGEVRAKLQEFRATGTGAVR